MIKRLDMCVYHLVNAICITSLVIMVVTVFLQVFTRYALRAPIGWTEEVGRYSLVVLTFFGTYLAFRRYSHMRIEIIYNYLPKHLKRLTVVFGNLLMLASFAVLIRYGFLFSFRFLGRISPVLKIPLGYVYMVVPIAAILWAYFIIVQTVEVIKDNDHPLIRGKEEDVTTLLEESRDDVLDGSIFDTLREEEGE